MKRLAFASIAGVLLAGPAFAAAQQNFQDYLAARVVAGSTQAGDYVPLLRGGVVYKILSTALTGSGGAGTPGGSDTQIQYNNSGAFGGLSNVGVTARIQPFSSALSGAVPASGGGTANFLRADGSFAPPSAAAASISTAGIAKLHNVPIAVGWVAAVNPNNAVIAVVNQASTVSAIIGAIETATGGASTVSVNKAPSGTACSAGTPLHSGSVNANGTAATNQALTVTTASLDVGDRLCLQTTGSTTWTSGTGSGVVTVFLAPS